MADRIAVSLALHSRMVEVARAFRKEPTPSERVLWRALRGQRLCGAKFRRQQPIGPFVVDYFCAEQGLIVEVDGPIHVTQVERDRERQALLEACGYRVLRVSASDVEQDAGAVLERVRQALVPHRPDPRALRGRGGAGASPLPRQGEGPGVRAFNIRT